MTLNQLRHNILVQELDNQPLIEQLTIPGLCIPEPHQKSESIHHTEEISRTSRDRGNLIHKLIKSYFLGESLSCADSIKPYWENLFPILQDIHDVRLIEGNIFHYYEGYVGRVDCVASYHGIPCVIEFKSADRIKRLYDEPLQLAAYCGALNRQYGVKYGVSLNHALLIVTTPDEVSLTWFDPNEVMNYWHKWQQRVAQFWAQQKAIA